MAGVLMGWDGIEPVRELYRFQSDRVFLYTEMQNAEHQPASRGQRDERVNNTESGAFQSDAITITGVFLQRNIRHGTAAIVPLEFSSKSRRHVAATCMETRSPRFRNSL
ncbi:hypothetical protein QLX08_000037 [Tetragonisca angustula]|uniref:Uncharacterized protein n=1 Tax=Tetragonisca angustula TaxID=166442 RepID=A0AAW1AMN5_9HYME